MTVHIDTSALIDALTGSTPIARAAALYRQIPKPRGREIDLAIAATALAHGAAILTLNPQDFSDIPDLRHLKDKGHENQLVSVPSACPAEALWAKADTSPCAP